MFQECFLESPTDDLLFPEGDDLPRPHWFSVLARLPVHSAGVPTQSPQLVDDEIVHLRMLDTGGIGIDEFDRHTGAG